MLYAYAMNSEAGSFTYKCPGFLASVWMQIRTAVAVGMPPDDELGSVSGCEGAVGKLPTRRAIRSSGNYSGRLTRNGLGSLDIGGGRSGLEE